MVQEKQESNMMSSRDKILEAVKKNQPASTPLPELIPYEQAAKDNLQKFTQVLQGIGGELQAVNDMQEVVAAIRKRVAPGSRVVTTIPALTTAAELISDPTDPHQLENVELAVIASPLAVAENAAVWVTEEQVKERVLPFICQQLAVVINSTDIVPAMHEAYEKIGSASYGYGTFIAGPSKTADIEQSLVLGAHGPKRMLVFILQ